MVAFGTGARIGNFFEFSLDANGPFDGIFDLAGNDITATPYGTDADADLCEATRKLCKGCK
jgi:hypothetical protein